MDVIWLLPTAIQGMEPFNLVQQLAQTDRLAERQRNCGELASPIIASPMAQLEASNGSRSCSRGGGKKIESPLNRQPRQPL